MEENKQPKIETIGHSISSLLLESIKDHQTYMSIAHLGGRDLKEQESLSRNARASRKVRSLPRIISAQLSMIRVSLSIVKIESTKAWKKEHPTSSDKEISSFDIFDCDYSELVAIKFLLNHWEGCIRKAEWTNTIKDDFIQTIQHERENYAVNDLVPTDNFYKMIKDLEDTFEGIYSILLNNGLITSIQEDIKLRRKSNEVY